MPERCGAKVVLPDRSQGKASARRSPHQLVAARARWMTTRLPHRPGGSELAPFQLIETHPIPTGRSRHGSIISTVRFRGYEADYARDHQAGFGIGQNPALRAAAAWRFSSVNGREHGYLISASCEGSAAAIGALPKEGFRGVRAKDLPLSWPYRLTGLSGSGLPQAWLGRCGAPVRVLVLQPNQSSGC